MPVSMIGFLHFGQAPGPFLTKRVNVRHLGADRYQAWFEGRWRTVHVQVKRLHIVVKGERIPIQIAGL